MENYKQDFLQSCLFIYYTEEKMRKKWTQRSTVTDKLML
jgi:hypothetical protein